MTARSIRRAAERKARKLARKAEKQETPWGQPFEAAAPFPGRDRSFDPAPEPPPSDEAATFTVPEMEKTPSPAQLAANRANAQLSTGPRTATGKEVSKLNAVKTGLTGRTVLLPTDDAAAYEHHVREFMKELNPVGTREQALAQSIADSMWRVLRIPSLESAIFARGFIEFAGLFENEDPERRLALIEAHTFLTYQKQIRNLHIQEARLQRQRAKDMAELQQLQQERIEKEKQEMEAAVELYLAARKDNRPFDPTAFGFVFSTADIEAHLTCEQRKSLLHAA